MVKSVRSGQGKKVTATKNKQAWKESRSDYPDLVTGTILAFSFGTVFVFPAYNRKEAARKAAKNRDGAP